MAQSIKEIKRRIASTKKTGQITKAMYMVSQSKVKRSSRVRNDYQSYMNSIKNLTRTAFVKENGYQSPLLGARKEERALYLLISSDTGLAGGYNNQVFKLFKETTANKSDFLVATIGRKAYNFASGNGYNLINKQAILIRDDVMFLDIVPITRALIGEFMAGKIDHVYVIYNHYINSMQSDVICVPFLPLDKIGGEVLDGDYVFEGGVEECLDDLITMYVESLLYDFVLDAKACEHQARMNAMKSASDNVDEIVDKLDHLYNQARQQAITTELIDIISGSNAINLEEKEKSLDMVANSLYQEYAKKSEVFFVTIYSVTELSGDEEKQIKSILAEYYQHKQIHLIKKIDESILNGYYLFVNNERIDFNLDNMLTKLRNLV